jgi:hypothetical protein
MDRRIVQRRAYSYITMSSGRRRKIMRRMALDNHQGHIHFCSSLSQRLTISGGSGRQKRKGLKMFLKIHLRRFYPNLIKIRERRGLYL